MASIQSRLVKFLLGRLDLFGGGEIDVVKLRSRFDRMVSLSRAHRRVSVSPAEIDGVPAEWLIPRDAPDDRALLYLHGGGWMVGSARMYRSFVSKLAFSCRTRALVIDYRLAPEHPFPAALDDCIAAYDHLVAGGVRPERIVVAGDSAGGNLTLALLVVLRDGGKPLPGAAVVISAVTDLTASGDSYQSRAEVDLYAGGHEDDTLARWYAGEYPLDHPLVSPLFADLHDLPPLLLHVGDHEILLDDATRFAARARDSGVDATLVVWPEMFHVFHTFTPFIPEARQANREIAEFIRAHLE
jgi:acetyl esterase/lipase